ELREHHCRRTPDARAVDVEVRHLHHDVRRKRSLALFPSHCVRIQETRDRQLDETLDFILGKDERWTTSGDPDDGLKEMAADDHRYRRQPSEDLDICRGHT